MCGAWGWRTSPGRNPACSPGLPKGGYRVFDGGSSVLSVVPLSTDPETLADRLAEHGVAVRAGLHCAPLAHLTAGTSETGTLRFSASVFNTPREADAVLELL